MKDKGFKTFNHFCIVALIILIGTLWLANTLIKANEHYVPGVWYECTATDEWPYTECVDSGLEPAPWASEKIRLEWQCLNPTIDHRTGTPPAIPDACIKLADLNAGVEQNQQILPTATPVKTSFQEQIRLITNQTRLDGVGCAAYPPLQQWATPHSYAPGAATLVVDESLAANAQAYAEHMARTGDYKHQAIEALQAAGAYSENIAYLGATVTYNQHGVEVARDSREEEKVAPDFVQGWIDSAGHCHNMMQPQWGKIGVGVALSEDKTYYGVQVFAP